MYRFFNALILIVAQPSGASHEVLPHGGSPERHAIGVQVSGANPLDDLSFLNGENMWESSGEGYMTQPNSPYRDPPLQPNICDGFIHDEKRSEIEEPINEEDNSCW